MIIKARHHSFIYPFFQWYTRWKIRKSFHDVRIIGDYREKGLPVLVLANHAGWWDGFWIMYLNIKIIRKKLHFMMLEDQLKKHWYFNYTGGYSVRKGSRTVIESLRYTAEILSSPGNMVFMFPQGEIRSMHIHEMDFEAGTGRILDYCANEIQVLFVANIIEYLTFKKPVLYIHLSAFDLDGRDTASLQKGYNEFYKRSIDSHKAISI